MAEQDDKANNSVQITGSGNIVGGIGQGKSRVDARVEVHQTAPQTGFNNPQQLYDFLQQRIDALKDDLDKQMAQLAVTGLKDELAKGETADAATLEKRMEGIRKTLGDAFEVAIATIANPAAGFAVIARKIAEKAVSSKSGQ